MLKILHTYTHTAYGGGQTMLLSLIDGLSKNRVSSVVICSKDNLKFIEELKEKSIKFIPINSKNLVLENKFLKAIFQFPNFLLTVLKTAKTIKEEKPDIVQANIFYSALFSVIPAKLYRKPFIWIAQTPSDLLRYKTLTRFLIWSADRTILTCKDFIRIARENGFNTSKLHTIYAGLKMEDYWQRENSGKEITINNREIKKPIIAMIARFDRYQKGHQYFIKAAEIIRKRFTEANFLIIGEATGPEEKKFQKELEKKVKKLGLSDRIIFAGFYADLNYLLSNIEVVVIPSLYEAPSAVALEAMAMKRPVVASKAGGIPEVVVEGKTGFLVPVKNSQAIADKVIFLLEHPEIAKKMGQQGHLRVKENFTREKLTREYEKVYNDLLKK